MRVGNRKIRVPVSQMFSLLLISVSALASTPAMACHNEIERVRDPRIDALQLADKLLLETDNANAAKIVDRHFPGLRAQKLVRGVLALRGARVLALVSVRSDGGWYQSGELTLGSEKERAANLAWAVRQLDAKAQGAPHSTSPQADLGEAMARVPSERLRARFLLEEMDKVGRLRSPFALAALAELRERSGDAAGAKAARRECVHRTRNAAICKARPKESEPSS